MKYSSADVFKKKVIYVNLQFFNCFTFYIKSIKSIYNTKKNDVCLSVCLFVCSEGSRRISLTRKISLIKPLGEKPLEARGEAASYYYIEVENPRWCFDIKVVY